MSYKAYYMTVAWWNMMRITTEKDYGEGRGGGEGGAERQMSEWVSD